jgi:predicted nucleic acid-binding protein
MMTFTSSWFVAILHQSADRAFLDAFCSLAKEASIYFRWRPFLSDPMDDLVFECALASGATHIITHNVRDFTGVEHLGVSVVTPQDFMRILPPR